MTTEERGTRILRVVRGNPAGQPMPSGHPPGDAAGAAPGAPAALRGRLEKARGVLRWSRTQLERTVAFNGPERTLELCRAEVLRLRAKKRTDARVEGGRLTGHPDWPWVLIEMPPPRGWRIAGVFATEPEAKAALAKVPEGWVSPDDPRFLARGHNRAEVVWWMERTNPKMLARMERG